MSALGYLGWVAAIWFAGWLSGWVNVHLIDSKRRHEQERAEDAVNEAKLREGRINQFIGFKRHDFVADRDREQVTA